MYACCLTALLATELVAAALLTVERPGDLLNAVLLTDERPHTLIYPCYPSILLAPVLCSTEVPGSFVRAAGLLTASLITSTHVLTAVPPPRDPPSFCTTPLAGAYPRYNHRSPPSLTSSIAAPHTEMASPKSGFT